jgi:hypothetical protein
MEKFLCYMFLCSAGNYLESFIKTFKKNIYPPKKATPPMLISENLALFVFMQKP